MPKLSKKIDGKHIILTFSRGYDYPGMKIMNETAEKFKYDPPSFRLAVRDWWDGIWETSPYRSASCTLAGHELTKKGMIWYRRNAHKIEKVVKESRKTEYQRMPRTAMARHGGFKLSNLMMDQSCLCPCCGVDLIEVNDYELDHIQPISKGGCNEYWNLQFLCAPCNRSKSDKDPFVWAALTKTELPAKFLAHHY